MKLEHIAIYVEDIEITKAFYKKYFGAISNEKYHNPKTGLQTYFLTFESGSRLEIMSKPNLPSNENSRDRLGYIHIAFKLGSEEAVDKMTNILRDDGYTIIGDPRTTGDGYYESTCLDPDGNIIELVA